MDISNKQRRKLLVGLFCLLLAFFIASIFCTTSLTQKMAKAENAIIADSYYIGEDRDTLGLWYTGEKGTTEFASNRIYGKSGVILLFHGQTADGAKTADLVNPEDPYEDNHDTFEGMKSAHYVEYAPWVTRVYAPVVSDMLWNNRQNTIEKIHSLTKLNKDTRYLKQLLYIDFDDPGNPEKKIGSPCEFIVGDRSYEITVNDENWHIITLYIGSPYDFHTSVYSEMEISVSDTEGNQLASERIKDTSKGVYVSFAVKGSVVITASDAGFLNAAVSGIFFDEITTNNEIGTENLSLTRIGARTISLTWDKTNNSLTNVYRKLKDERQYQYITTLDEGVNSYVDEDTLVNSEYEYTLTSGLKRHFDEDNKSEWDYWDYTMQNTEYERMPGPKDFNLINFEDFLSIKTAPYAKTYIEASSESLSCIAATSQDDPNNVHVKFTLYKDSVFNENGEIESKSSVYEGREIAITLDGDNVFSDIGGKKLANMQADFGKMVTNEKGEIQFSFTMIYPGEYTLSATVNEYMDENDLSGNSGYDKYVKTINLVVTEQPEEESAPILLTINDAVKPGETVSISGFYIKDDGDLKVAYKKNDGDPAGQFNEDGAKYINVYDIDVVDNLSESILMFDLPNDIAAGIYDFYVHTSSGWSEGITLNAARPLFLDQEGAYEGQKIQISGRNFLLSEFGAANKEASLSKLAVKLTLIKDDQGNSIANGNTVILNQKNGNLLTGLKETKESALQYQNEQLGIEGLQAEAIPYSTEYKITFIVPKVFSYGTYMVSVANDGEYFVACQEPTHLKIVEKVTQKWNTTVFGSDYSAHIGNDPLDLGVYWAQYLNYSNVEIMSQNTAEEANDLTDTLNQSINNVNAMGGGVIYFPEGTYYLGPNVFMKSNVMIVGAGQDKTEICYIGDKGTVWFRGRRFGEKASSNVGIARLTLSCQHESLYHEGEGWYVPDRIISFDSTEDYGIDIDKADSENKFIIDVEVKGKLRTDGVPAGGNQSILVGAHKNVIYKNLRLNGPTFYNRVHYYTTCYNVWDKCRGAGETPIIQGKYTFIENVYFDIGYKGHGLSIRSDTYVGYTYLTGAGDRETPTNDGETLLAEVPSGYMATGKVIYATPQSVTLNFMGGERITDETLLHFNYFAVCITDGKGAGQIRYINRIPTGGYGNCYTFLEGQKDWDVIPDHTSVFTVYSPLKNITISHYKGYDCVSSLALYTQAADAVVADCRLHYTGGIEVAGFSVGGLKNGRSGPAYNIRIVRNEISGVGANYNLGVNHGSGCGGIRIYSSGGNGDYLGSMISGVTVKDNYLHDLIPEVPDDGYVIKNGIIVESGDTAGVENKGKMKAIIIENNILENSESGLYVDSAITGVVLKGNTVSGTTSGVDATIYNPTSLVGKVNVEFYINGDLADFSGIYSYSDLLPEAHGMDDTIFYGWTTEEAVTANPEILITVPAVNSKLYAVFGYQVTFDYNYLKSDGSEKGEYTTIKVIKGNNVKDEIDAYGEPFRNGYDFVGWYLDKDCTKVFDPSLNVSENITVYAKWNGGAINDSEKNEGQIENNQVQKIIIISVVAVAGLLIISGGLIFLKKHKKSN